MLLDSAQRRKPSERIAFIEGACRDDDALHDEVLDLLDASESQSGPPAAAPALPQDRAGTIVSAALSRRRNERLAYVEGACGGDEGLRVRALALLASVDTAGAPAAVRMVEPAAPSPVLAPEEEPSRIAPENPAEAKTRIAPPAPAQAPVASPPLDGPSCEWHAGQTLEGRRVGPYQLIRSLGKGGMGSVYAASRADQEYKKVVAIKLVTAGLDTEEMLQRFRKERQLLASLDHPYIARLLDGGSTEDGLPYLVMEYVEGLAIDRYCESHHLSLIERLKLFQKVCSAVQYAHQNLLIHRDIKPGNILVGTNGEPKLLDFGIARLMNAESSAEDMELTRGGGQPMTLRYASPEQIRGEPLTTESDIYSLGVLLYEMLAGEHPFADAMIGRAEIQNAILNRTPEKPSAVVRRRAEDLDKRKRHAALKLARHLDGEIDPIVLSALTKQPRGRPPSAESFSLDITRYLNGFPVSQRRDEVGYRARKFITRHAFSVVGAVVVAIALVTSTIVSFEFLQNARAAHAKAQNRFEDVRKLAHFVLFEFDDKIRSGTTAARKVLVTEALDYLNRLAKDSAGDVSLERELVDGYLKVGDLQGNPNGPNIGDPAGAKESYSKALSVAQALRARNPRDTEALQAVARVSRKLADLSEFGGNPMDALQLYHQAQTTLEPLAEADPAAKATLVILAERIGTMQLQLGNTSDALDSFRHYLKLAEEMANANPTDAAARRRVALANDKLGETMAKSGAVSEGLERLNQARTIYEELASSDPQGATPRRNVANINNVIGDTLTDQGKPAQAVQNYRQALRLAEALVAEDPRNIEYKRDIGATLGRLASALFADGKREESHAVTKRALEVLRPMVDAPGAIDYDIYQSCWLLVTTPFRDLQAPALAQHYAEQLVKNTGGKDPNYLDLLARAYDVAGDPARAVDTEAKALALLPAGSVSELRTELTKNLANFRARAKRQQTQ